MPDTVVDVPLNWYQAIRLYSGDVTPPVAFIQKHAQQPIDIIDDGNQVSVFWSAKYYTAERLREARDYLRDCMDCRTFQMYGRFEIKMADFESRKRCLGLNFVFKSKAEAATFAFVACS